MTYGGGAEDDRRVEGEEAPSELALGAAGGVWRGGVVVWLLVPADPGGALGEVGLGPVGRDVPPLGLEGQVQLRRVGVKVALEGIVWGSSSIAAGVGATVGMVGRWVAKRRRFQNARWLLTDVGSCRTNVVGPRMRVGRCVGIPIAAIDARATRRRCGRSIVSAAFVVISGVLDAGGSAAPRRQYAGIHRRLVGVDRSDHDWYGLFGRLDPRKAIKLWKPCVESTGKGHDQLSFAVAVERNRIRSKRCHDFTKVRGLLWAGKRGRRLGQKQAYLLLLFEPKQTNRCKCSA